MDISIELVPRSPHYLKETLVAIQQQLPEINAINIPDIVRIAMRSWEGCQVARPYFPTSIPHLRAIDTTPDQPLLMLDAICEIGLTKVLVVTGDYGAEDSIMVNSIDLIRRIKREYPMLELYAALDPYRSDIASEVAYARQKLTAGATGFFTQPFFDMRLVELYADQLSTIPIYWGAAPVVTSRSRKYWEKRNRAIFPPSFDYSLAWNQALAQSMLDFARNRGDHVYFMPIRVNIFDYLCGIL